MRDERRHGLRVLLFERRFDEKKRVFRGDAHGGGLQVVVFEMRPDRNDGTGGFGRRVEAAERDQGVQPHTRVWIVDAGQHGFSLRRVVIDFARAYEPKGVPAKDGVFVVERGAQERLLECAKVV